MSVHCIRMNWNFQHWLKYFRNFRAISFRIFLVKTFPQLLSHFPFSVNPLEFFSMTPAWLLGRELTQEDFIFRPAFLILHAKNDSCIYSQPRCRLHPPKDLPLFWVNSRSVICSWSWRNNKTKHSGLGSLKVTQRTPLVTFSYCYKLCSLRFAYEAWWSAVLTFVSCWWFS